MSATPRPAPLSRRVVHTALATVAASSVAVGILLPTPARAAVTGDGIVISQFYGRGGSTGQPYANKFVELYNPTASAIALTGTSLQYRPAPGTAAASDVCVLSGSVAPRGHYLIQLAGNGTAGWALPTPDTTCAGVNPSGTAGTVFVAKGTAAINPGSQATVDPAVIDLLGYGSANVYEKALATYPGTNTTVNSLVRTDGVDTDNNAADFTPTATVTPRASTPPPPGSATASPTAAPTATPTATPTPVPGGAVTIAQIQGTTDASPLAGRTVSTRGIVTASYPTGGFNGYYIQTPGSGGAAKRAGEASDGVFVYSTTTQAIGTCLDVTGKVSEYNGLTEISATAAHPVSECEAVRPTDLAALPATDADREPYEGMLVRPLGSYTVTSNYATNQYGQVGLAFGTTPLPQSTDVALPGTEAAAVEAANRAREITLDDGSSWNYMSNATAKTTAMPYITDTTRPRLGALTTFPTPVILDYRFQWNFQPTQQVTGATNSPATFADTRPAGPAPVRGTVTVATFNVENFFSDLGQDEANCKAHTDRNGTPVQANGCKVRGAYTPAAYADHLAKELASLTTLDADVVGLEEIENSAQFGHPRDHTLSLLVDALNAKAGRTMWAFVASPATVPGREDVIRTAFIYKTATVAPVGESIILTDPAFTGIARQPLAQQFRASSGGDPFVVIANHFKSKGSPPDPGSARAAGNTDTGDGQGNWNALRVEEAKALVRFAQRWSGQALFLIGDFNAYSMEDPVRAITAAGYTDVATVKDPEHRTYQYSGRYGSMDHVFANQAAYPAVAGATVWGINAEEPIAGSYGRRNYNIADVYAADPYATSDHNPIKVGFTPLGAAAPTVPPAAGVPLASTPSGTPSPSTTPAPAPGPTRCYLEPRVWVDGDGPHVSWQRPCEPIATGRRGGRA